LSQHTGSLSLSPTHLALKSCV